MFTATDVLVDAAAARREASRYHAVELQRLAEYARATEDDEFAHLEVAALLHISDRAAKIRLAFARTLTESAPCTLVALQEGNLEEYKAQLISEAVACLTVEQAAQVEALVLDRAAEQTPGQLRNALAKAVLKVDPEGAEERRKERVRERRVTRQPTEDGQAVLSIHHSADRIEAMYRAIATRAMHLKTQGGETRTLAQLEADIACELILGANAENVTVEVHVTLPPTGPAEIDGIGPITREAAMELAAEAKRWRWLRTNPDTGEVQDLTSPSYTPPAAMAEYIKIRDRTCRFVGCIRPARQCDTDHTIPWPDGKTCDSNCMCLCRGHHRAKHEGGWQLQQIKPGHAKWISPLGFTYTIPPEPVTEPVKNPDPPPF